MLTDHRPLATHRLGGRRRPAGAGGPRSGRSSESSSRWSSGGSQAVEPVEQPDLASTSARPRDRRRPRPRVPVRPPRGVEVKASCPRSAAPSFPRTRGARDVDRRDFHRGIVLYFRRRVVPFGPSCTPPRCAHSGTAGLIRPQAGVFTVEARQATPMKTASASAVATMPRTTLESPKPYGVEARAEDEVHAEVGS